VTIVGSELIRRALLSSDSKLVSVLAFLSCTVAEVLMVSSLVGITTMNKFMDVVGMTLFPALSANVYYHYVSKNYGALPNVIFRIITTQYIYFIPTVTAISDALAACIKIVFPLIMMAFLAALFAKRKKNARRKADKLSTAGMVVAIVIIASVAMLISCQFRFGALVIATDSMTGEINKGDMIIYERYDDQVIREGQVVVFMSDNNNRIVHRVVRIENIDGETRYYTKGDFNKEEDYGFRTDADIVGLTDIKVAYVGYPTLWLHELISN
jgi:signal peptidase I